MSALLNIFSQLTAYEGTAPTSSPSLVSFNWKRSAMGLDGKNADKQEFLVEPGSEKVVFDASRATSVDVTTQFTLALSALSPTRYRFTWTAGNDPGLRASRSLVTTAVALTLVVNANGTLTMTAGAGTPFASVQVGDTLFIPGPTTGDSSLGFNAANEGEWVVLGIGGSGASVILMRPAGKSFDGVGESVTPSGDLLAYAGVGVQVGDQVEISAGFSTPVQRTFQVAAVTSKWFEVESSLPLAPEVAVPGPTGIAFYSGAKRFVRIETDQESVVHANGDTGVSNRLAPWSPGDPDKMAEYTKVGPMWKLSVLNRASVPMRLIVLSCE